MLYQSMRNARFYLPASSLLRLFTCSPRTPPVGTQRAARRFRHTRLRRLQGSSAMAAASRYTRAISSEVGEIERRLRVLEKSVEKSARGRLRMLVRPLMASPRRSRQPCSAGPTAFARAQAHSATSRRPSAKMPRDTGARRSPALPRKPNSVRCWRLRWRSASAS